ncbi:transposase [Olsenella phocaeensis]|uniref:transposase n=1 Tax=Olsenella phocaeensis TaxID=1852385 RepID=UPI003A940B14
MSAFSITAEVGDFSRFPDARSFMSYVGLVPSESSSGESRSRGRITKTGNGHVRRLLVEASWHHARAWPPALETQREAAAKLAPRDAASARKANRRLHDRYAALSRRGKAPNLVKVAVAREMAGFVWALATGAE